MKTRPIPGEHWHLASDNGFMTTLGCYVDRIDLAWVFGTFGEMCPLTPPDGWHWQRSSEYVQSYRSDPAVFEPTVKS